LDDGGFERAVNLPEGIDISALEKVRDSSDSDGEDGRGSSFTDDLPVDVILQEDVDALNQLYDQVVGECRDAYDKVKTVLSNRVESERRSTANRDPSAPPQEVAAAVEGQLSATATKQLSGMLQVLKKRLHQLTEFTGVNVLAFQKILKKRAKSIKNGSAAASTEVRQSLASGDPASCGGP